MKPRLIERFEPWHVTAFARQVMLELCFRYTRLHHNFMPRANERIHAAAGSNAWAIGPGRTRSGNAMLFINPHQPWFGFGQMYEAHLRSGEGINFTGATFFGNPLPTIGHNEHAGWAMTTNEPDVADLWRETFDDNAQPAALPLRRRIPHRHGMDRYDPREDRQQDGGPAVRLSQDASWPDRR